MQSAPLPPNSGKGERSTPRKRLIEDKSGDLARAFENRLWSIGTNSLGLKAE